ncbi:MAG: hypothetical protein GX660_05795, partial [Clostridiaceae bacterium]|nr:hypothetical protein [Clostridiaceae bacterium]
MAIPISGTFEPDGNFKLVDAQHISLGEETLSTTVNTIKTNNDELVQINANSLDYNLSDLSVETSDPSSVYAVSASKKSIKVEHRNDPHSIKVWIPIRGLEIGKTYNFSAVYTRNGTDTSASIRLFQSNKTTSILPVYETSESVQSFVATEDMLYIRVYCAGAQAWVDINNISIIEVRAAIKGNVTVGNMTANVLTQKIKTLDSGIEDGTSFAIGQLNDTQSLIIEDNDIKKNNQISFFGKISTFTQLSVGHGKAVMYANYVKIDDTNLKIMSGEGDTVAVTEAHNLTIADY